MRQARIIAVGVLAAVLCAAALPAAWAGDPFANYVTKVSRIEPDLPGVSATAASDGAYIVVHNTSTAPLVIEGYQHEPYLRITDHGVWENQRSPAVYLNKEQFIDSIPGSVNADKAPRWKKVSGGSSMRWHDHRIHWMSATQPPSVAAAPGKPHLIKRWTIPVKSGARKAEIAGTLSWRPGGHLVRVLTWAAIGVALLLVVGLGIVVRRRQGAPASSRDDPA